MSNEKHKINFCAIKYIKFDFKILILIEFSQIIDIIIDMTSF